MALLDRVVKFVEGLLETHIPDSQKNDIAAFIAENEKYVSFENTTELVSVLATEYTNIIQKQSGNLNINNFLGITSLDELKLAINPRANRKIAYVCLDSRYARFSPDCKHLQWDVYNAISEYGNSTNVLHNLRNITRVRCASIVTRKFPSSMGRASILIEELSAQSFVFPNGKRFHFLTMLNDLQRHSNLSGGDQMLSPADISDRNQEIGSPVIPTPVFAVADFTIYDKYELLMGYRFNQGIYNFNIPVNVLNTITISIGDPVDLLIIPKYEYFNATVIAQIGSPFAPSFQNFIVVLKEPHNLNPNSILGSPGNPYSIFLDGLIANHPNSPNDVNFVNLANTLEWSTVGIIDNNTLDVGLDNRQAGLYYGLPTPVSLPPPQQLVFENVHVRINSFRVIINLEIEYSE